MQINNKLLFPSFYENTQTMNVKQISSSRREYCSFKLWRQIITSKQKDESIYRKKDEKKILNDNQKKIRSKSLAIGISQRDIKQKKIEAVYFPKQRMRCKDLIYNSINYTLPCEDLNELHKTNLKLVRKTEQNSQPIIKKDFPLINNKSFFLNSYRQLKWPYVPNKAQIK